MQDYVLALGKIRNYCPKNTIRLFHFCSRKLSLSKKYGNSSMNLKLSSSRINQTNVDETTGLSIPNWNEIILRALFMFFL